MTTAGPSDALTPPALGRKPRVAREGQLMDKARTILRLYADVAGESRFDEVSLVPNLKDFALPAPALCITEPAPATRQSR